MTPRRTALLAGVLAALTAAAAILWKRSSGLEEAAPLAQWPVERIARIELARSGTRFVLEKKAGRWEILEPIRDWADREAAEELAASLKGLSLGAVVSRDPSGAAAYGLADLGAIHVKAFVEGAAAPVLDGSFGSPALGDAALYFRGKRESVIRLATGFPPELLTRQAATFRERRLVPRSRERK